MTISPTWKGSDFHWNCAPFHVCRLRRVRVAPDGALSWLEMVRMQRASDLLTTARE